MAEADVLMYEQKKRGRNEDGTGHSSTLSMQAAL